MASSPASSPECARCRIADPLGPRRASLDSWHSKGAKRILFYRLQFSGETSPPTTVEEVEAAMQQVNLAFRRMSYAQLSFDWVTTPALVLPRTANQYVALTLHALIEDARAAAGQVGFNFEDYDFDLLRTSVVAGWAGGTAALFDRWAWVASTDATLILHELGHALGLPHANSWETDRPNPFLKVSPPFPSNIASLPDEIGHDPDSLVGRPGIMVPGTSVEYGDDYDPMGSGFLEFDFGLFYKRRLGWLAESNLSLIRTSGVYRLHTFNTSNLLAGRAYGLRIEREIVGRQSDLRSRRYWIQFHTGLDRYFPGLDQGVQLHWIDTGDELSSLLLDATPGSRLGFLDSVLLRGRTFVDPGAELCITPLDQGGAGDARWFDVAVMLGPASANQPPGLSVEASAQQVAPGQAVSFSATVQDPEGDSLAYFWDLTEGQRLSGTNRASRTWTRSGDYIVRCEVSDLRGGLASRNLVIRVGTPGTGRITGRVLDTDGRGLQGCRVHTGRVDYSAWDRPDFFASWSDSVGVYTLICSNAATYSPGAALDGYRLISPAPGTAVTIPASGSATLDFVMEPIPRVSAESSMTAAQEGTSDAGFIFTRSGPVEPPVEVWFHLGGMAGPEDYGGELTAGRVTIPSGTNALFVPVSLRRDLAIEEPETLLLTLVPRRQSVRTEVVDGQTNFITVYYPGWDLGPYQDGQRWFLTEPPYTFSAQPPAEITILDTTPQLPRLSVFAGEPPPREDPPSAGYYRISRSGDTNETLQVSFLLEGQAVNGVDFEAVPEWIEMPGGVTDVMVPIVPLDDDIYEGNERVVLILSQPPDLSYVVETATAELVIEESDPAVHRLALGESWGWGKVLEIYGEFGRTCLVDTSTNLVHWEPLTAIVIDFQPTIVGIPPFWLDRARFYRSRLAPLGPDTVLPKPVNGR